MYQETINGDLLSLNDLSRDTIILIIVKNLFQYTF